MQSDVTIVPEVEDGRFDRSYNGGRFARLSKCSLDLGPILDASPNNGPTLTMFHYRF